ncbi:lysis protein [Klebsiella oxytoca]|jgi:prophage endopeptidase|uniref:lysis protein n=1 Tax=Klebsiella TaxID=570 RepID=UPI001C81021D|nr:lysis protein [Klebsiella sp. CVUAS 8534.2]MBX4756456.1 lysis protein [Klebsiella sp. CVUAS 8534.2]HBM3057529.1 lysis protein [Klebsiella oxytoca]
MSRSAEIVCAVVIVALSIIGWLANHYHGKYQQEQKRADTAEQSLKLANETITNMQARQHEIAALDAKYTKELANAKAENDVLRRRLDAGGRVLVKGRCPVSASAKTTGSASMGDDAAVELSSVAGRNVLGIRAGIISDQTALRALQEYINTQCLR